MSEQTGRQRKTLTEDLRLFKTEVVVTVRTCFAVDRDGVNPVSLRHEAVEALNNEVNTNGLRFGGQIRTQEILTPADIPDGWEESCPWGEAGGIVSLSALLQWIKEDRIESEKDGERDQ